MKRFYRYMTLLLLGALTAVACTDDMEYDNDGTVAVKALLSPVAGSQLWLINTAEATSLFEWEPVGETTTQKYFVVFYNQASGGSELMRVNNNSTKCEALIYHDDLTRLAAKAGIQPAHSGDVYWSVISYNGNKEKPAEASRNKLTLTRYDAIDDVPQQLYLAGVADKNGDVLRKFYSMGDGRFEIYAQVKADEQMFLTNRGDGGVARRFYTTVTDGVTSVLEGNDASASYDGIYHFVVDFNTSRVKVEHITDVAYFYCWTGGTGTTMTYTGNGIWKLSGYTIPTGDNRYRFRAMVDGVEYIWGAPKSQDAEPSSLEGNYYDLTFTARGSNDQWGYKYKFMSATKGYKADIYLYLTGERNYHMLDFGNVQPQPVTATEMPASLASSTAEKPVDLADIGATASVFKWTPAVATYGLPLKFRVIFYLNNKEIKRLDAGVNTSLEVSAGQLDAMLSDAGIVAKQSATLTWSVESYILDKSAAQTVERGTFSVIRLRLPEKLYLTGSATEFGTTLSTAKQMIEIGNKGGGSFQLYTQLTTGTYNFVSDITGEYTTYTLVGGKLSEGTAGIEAEAGVYRITAYIATKTLLLEKVTLVQLRNEGNGNWTNTLSYVSDGSWVTPSDMNISRVGNNGERYYFSATVGGVEELWGYSRQNNDPETYHWQATDTRYNNLPPQYIYVRKRGTISRWDYTFKDGRGSGFSTEHDFRKAQLFMNGDTFDTHAHYHVTGVWGQYYSGDRTAVIDTHFVHIANN